MTKIQDNSERKLRIFLSYSRRNLDIADMLVMDLESAGFEVSIDRRDLPYGEKWQNELAEMIRCADAVVWLVSPDSIKSQWCKWELNEVTRLAKRLVPILIDTVAADELPEDLGRIHLLPAVGTFNLSQHTPILVKTLNTDRQWVIAHTRLGERSFEWTRSSKNSAVLLRGAALANAEAWQARPARGEQIATDVSEYILASRRAATTRQRAWIVGGVTTAIVTSGLALFAYLQSIEVGVQRDIAVQQKSIAEKSEKVALQERDNALLNESDGLAKLSQERRASGDVSKAVALAWAALPHDSNLKDRPVHPAAVKALIEARYELQESSGSAHAYDGVQDGSAPAVEFARFSNDGSKLLTGANGSARISDMQGAIVQINIEELGYNLKCAIYSADGSKVFTGGEFGPVIAWDANTGKKLFAFGNESNGTTALAVNPTNGTVLSTSFGGHIRIWNASDGKPLDDLFFQPQHSSFPPRIEELIVSPTGTHLFARNWGGVGQIWNFKNRTAVDLSGPGSTGVAAFSTDGTSLVTGGSVAKIWDVATGAEDANLLSNVSRDRPPDLVSIAIRRSRNGQDEILAGGKDGVLRRWSINGNLLQEASVTGSALAFGHDGQSAYVATNNHALEYWTASVTGGWTKQATFKGHTQEITSVVMAPSGKGAVSLSYDGTARNWQSGAASAAAVRVLEPGLVNVEAVALTPSGGAIAIGQTKDVMLLDLATGNLIVKLLGPSEGYPLVSKLKFLTDKQLIVGTKNGKIFIWDIEKRDIETIFEISPDPDASIVVTDLGVSSDGRRLLSTSGDSVARLWDIESGKLIREFKSPHGDLRSGLLSPDGRHIYTGTGENEIVVWDVESGQQSDTIPDRGEAMALDPSGKYLIASSHSKSPALWEIATKKRHALGLFGDTPTWIEFTGDGKLFMMAFGYYDSTIRVFETETRAIAYEIRAHKGSVPFASFTGDGASIVSAGLHDNSIRIFPRYRNLAELIASSRRVIESLNPLSNQEICALKLSKQFKGRTGFTCEASASQ